MIRNAILADRYSLSETTTKSQSTFLVAMDESSDLWTTGRIESIMPILEAHSSEGNQNVVMEHLKANIGTTIGEIGKAVLM